MEIARSHRLDASIHVLETAYRSMGEFSFPPTVSLSSTPSQEEVDQALVQATRRPVLRFTRFIEVEQVENLVVEDVLPVVVRNDEEDLNGNVRENQENRIDINNDGDGNNIGVVRDGDHFGRDNNENG